MKKRLLAVILILAMATSVFITNTFAFDMDGAKKTGDVPKVAASDITVDGKKDEAAWANALKIDIDTMMMGDKEGAASGVGYLLWDGKNIYAFFEINDPTLVTRTAAEQKEKPWQCDSVELFLDPGNAGNNIFQYRVDWEGWPSIMGQLEKSGDECKGFMECAVVVAGDKKSYTVEMKVMLNFQEGESIGYFLQINDEADQVQNADHRIIHSNPTRDINNAPSTSWNGEYYDYIVLSAVPAVEAPDVPAVVDVPPETEEPAATEEPTGTEEPVDIEEPAGSEEEPVDTEEPAETVEPTDTEEQTNTEEPGNTEEPVNTAPPDNTDKEDNNMLLFIIIGAAVLVVIVVVIIIVASKKKAKK